MRRRRSSKCGGPRRSEADLQIKAPGDALQFKGATVRPKLGFALGARSPFADCAFGHNPRERLWGTRLSLATDSCA